MSSINKFKRFLFLTFSLLLFPFPAVAQSISGDGTLNTKVTSSDGKNFNIDGGTTAGGNLFHSFGRFSVPTNGSASFRNDTSIDNIIGRVTGNSVSVIDGLIKANGGANLFLINPAGILFKENARLDIGGSFLGSTADSLLFPDGKEFSATNTSGKPLLTVNAPIGLSFRDNPGKITNRSIADNGSDLFSGIKVQPGNNITLVGGDINLDGGVLTATGGQIRLGGIVKAGEVKIAESGNLTLPEGVTRSNVSLSNLASINVSSEVGTLQNAGDINIQANNLKLTEGSFLDASAFGKRDAGTITVDADNSINLNLSSFFTNIEVEGAGEGGKIDINTKNLTLTSSSLNNSTFGQGDAGNINIKASDRVSLNASRIESLVGVAVGGKGGNINITAGDLSLTNGSTFRADTSGVGNAGNVLLDVDNAITLNQSSRIFSSVEPDAEGNGGKIDVQTTSLSLKEGSSFSAATFGRGNAGNVTVKADGNISIDGVGTDGFASGMFSSVTETGIGNAGGINITAKNISLSNQGRLFSSTTGKGNAGNIVVKADGDVRLTTTAEITSDVGSKNFISEAEGKAGTINITAGNLFLNDGATLSSSTFEVGKAGNILLKVDKTIALNQSSSIFSTVEAGAVGNGGKIDIQTNFLSLKEGSTLNATTFGKGNAGNLTIKATGDILIDGGADKNLSFTSAIGNNVQGEGVGNAGGINITTKNLTLTNGGILTSSTFGQGNAGSVKVNASDRVSLNGSTIFSTVEAGAVGNGGKIDIQTNSLSLKAGSALDATTLGRGNAGNITVKATNNVSIDGVSNNGVLSTISSNVEGEGIGNAGNIFVNAKNLSLTNGGRLISNTLSQGNAGSVNIKVGDRLSLDGSIILSLVGFDGQGKGGNINIFAGDISLTNSSNLRASTFGVGDAGKVTVKAKSDIVLSNNAEITSDVGSPGFITEAKGKAGTINIQAGNLSLNSGAKLSSSTYETGDAGSVTVNVSDRVSLDGSTIFSTVESGAKGKGGSIKISAGDLSMTNDSSLQAFTSGVGDAGSVLLNIDNTTVLNQSSRIFSSVSSDAEGNGGKIDVQTNSLSLKEGSSFSAATFGNGDAGNVTVKADGNISIDGVGSDRFASGIFSSVAETGIGDGGGVNITAKNLSLTNNSVISANTVGKGNAGDVIIKATDNIFLDGINSAISSDVFGIEEVSGGEIKINTSNLEVSDGAAITASTFGAGDAGKIEIVASDTINLDGQGSDGFASGIGSEVTELATGNAGGIKITTDNLFINNGAVINASTFGNGNAGTIEVIAKDKIAIDGNGSGIASSVTETGIGNAGGLSIEADSLTLSDNAEVTVESEGKGQAGNLSIDADSLTLDRGNILASTPFGTGGNIDLQVDGVLSLDNESKISAQALGNANGGNINIAAGFVVSFLNENSDIVAGAKEGQGGNISIDTRAIFGLEQRKSTPVNQTNDIDASSEFGLQGNISINSPDITPNQLGVELPENVMEPDEVVTQACSARTGNNNNGSFTISGRGGIPQNGTQPLTNDSIQVERSSQTRNNDSSQIQEDIKGNSSAVVTKVETSKPISSDDIIPAQGWTMNEKGQVVLTRYPTVDGNGRNTSKSIGCN